MPKQMTPKAETADDAVETSPSRGPDLTDQALAALEAVLVSQDRPTPISKIAEALIAAVDSDITEAGVVQGIDRLNAAYDKAGRAFRIEPVAGGVRVMTRPEYSGVVAAFHRAKSSARLSRAALETLSIVAYRQPVTRAKLEAIRGVACGEVLRTLLDRRLLTIKGRAEELGRPMLYGTTKQFLDTFGLASIKDLPKPEDFVSQG